MPSGQGKKEKKKKKKKNGEQKKWREAKIQEFSCYSANDSEATLNSL